MTYAQLKAKLYDHNLDDGCGVPLEILTDPNCDLALALEIFYLAEGDLYLNDPMWLYTGEAGEVSAADEWKVEPRNFVTSLYNDILSGRYPATDTHFKIPLSRVALYKLRKKQVPEVFLTDL